MAVIASAIASMIIGFVWYGPLFGKQWMHAMKINPKEASQMQKEGTPAMIGMLIASLVAAFVLAHVLSWGNAQTLMDGLMGGFLVWLGFVLTTQAGNYLFESKNQSTFFIGAAFQLVNFLVMGAILVSL